jgi:2-C-methyl-D-erythritol 4-phosphate cytidylyltransferase
MDANNSIAANLGVVIVAGGVGNRMGASVPKQFLKIGYVYILEQTLRAFLGVASEIVVVLPADQHERWAAIVAERGLQGTHKVCNGGATRFESVRNGLAALGEDCDLVAIHDGVRPLVSEQMILRGVAVAKEKGSAIPVVAPVDSFRIEGESGLEVIDRSRLRAIQTPQIFDKKLLGEAYDTPPSERFTDDATVVERLGIALGYYEGERSNIKITTPEDLAIAEALMGLQQKGKQ